MVRGRHRDPACRAHDLHRLNCFLLAGCAPRLWLRRGGFGGSWIAWGGLAGALGGYEVGSARAVRSTQGPASGPGRREYSLGRRALGVCQCYLDFILSTLNIDLRGALLDGKTIARRSSVSSLHTPTRSCIDFWQNRVEGTIRCTLTTFALLPPLILR